MNWQQACELPYYGGSDLGADPAAEETVLNGSYAIQRPFVLVTKTGETLSPAAQAFFDYATSSAARPPVNVAILFSISSLVMR